MMMQLVLPQFDTLVDWRQERCTLRTRIESGALTCDARTADFAMQLRDMLYDEAWCFEDWRLELVHLDEGHPHWRLYRGLHVYGIAEIYADKGDLGSSRKTPVVRLMLAALLVSLGWDLDRVTVRMATTPLDADVSRQWKLFKAKLKKKRVRQYDILKVTA